MGKQEDLVHLFQVYQRLGCQIIINACSSAIYVLSRSPILRRTDRVMESEESLAFILSGGIGAIAKHHFLNIDVEYLESQYFDKTEYMKELYLESKSI